MMDFDTALEHVGFDGAVVARLGWGEGDIVTRHVVDAPNGEQIGAWHSTRPLSTPDFVADDWIIIGFLH